MNRIQKQCEQESPRKVITSYFKFKGLDVAVEHLSAPLWDNVDEGYHLADSIKNNPYEIINVSVVGNKTHNLRLTDERLEVLNEMIEDDYTPQFTR